MFVFRHLQTKLFVSFVLLVLIPLLTLGFFSFRTATSSLEKETEQNQAQTVRLIGNNIKLMLDDAGDITSYIMNNVSLQSLLSRDYNGPVNTEQAAALAYLDNIKAAKNTLASLLSTAKTAFCTAISASFSGRSSLIQTSLRCRYTPLLLPGTARHSGRITAPPIYIRAQLQ